MAVKGSNLNTPAGKQSGVVLPPVGITIGAPNLLTVGYNSVLTYLVTYSDYLDGTIVLAPGDVSINQVGGVTYTINILPFSVNQRIIEVTQIGGNGTLSTVNIAPGTAAGAGGPAPSAAQTYTVTVSNPPVTISATVADNTAVLDGSPWVVDVNYTNAQSITLSGVTLSNLLTSEIVTPVNNFSTFNLITNHQLTSTTLYAQSFTMPFTGKLKEIIFKLGQNTTAVGGSVTMRIYSDSGGLPGSILYNSTQVRTVGPAFFTTTPNTTDVALPFNEDSAVLTSGVRYHAVLDVSSATGINLSNFLRIGSSITAISGETFRYFDSGVWTPLTGSLALQVIVDADTTGIPANTQVVSGSGLSSRSVSITPTNIGNRSGRKAASFAARELSIAANSATGNGSPAPAITNQSVNLFGGQNSPGSLLNLVAIPNVPITAGDWETANRFVQDSQYVYVLNSNYSSSLGDGTQGRRFSKTNDSLTLDTSWVFPAIPGGGGSGYRPFCPTKDFILNLKTGFVDNLGGLVQVVQNPFAGSNAFEIRRFLPSTGAVDTNFTTPVSIGNSGINIFPINNGAQFVLSYFTNVPSSTWVNQIRNSSTGALVANITPSFSSNIKGVVPTVANEAWISIGAGNEQRLLNLTTGSTTTIGSAGFQPFYQTGLGVYVSAQDRVHYLLEGVGWGWSPRTTNSYNVLYGDYYGHVNRNGYTGAFPNLLGSALHSTVSFDLEGGFIYYGVPGSVKKGSTYPTFKLLKLDPTSFALANTIQISVPDILNNSFSQYTAYPIGVMNGKCYVLIRPYYENTGQGCYLGVFLT